MLEAKHTDVLSDPTHPAWRKSNNFLATPVVSIDVSLMVINSIEVLVLQHVWPGSHALPFQGLYIQVFDYV